MLQLIRQLCIVEVSTMLGMLPLVKSSGCLSVLAVAIIWLVWTCYSCRCGRLVPGLRLVRRLCVSRQLRLQSFMVTAPWCSAMPGTVCNRVSVVLMCFRLLVRLMGACFF